MTKKERLEKLLQEIPCLYKDYQQGTVRRYSPFGRYDLSPEELDKAKSVIGKNKLLSIVEQEMSIAGKSVYLVHYLIDEKGFTPKKEIQINPAVFNSNARIINECDYMQTAYVFRAYCYNATWDQYDHGSIGIIPIENTVIRIW